jgi:hypothetical protein
MVAPIDILRSVRIRQHRLTYLPHRALWDLAREVRRVDRENVPGIILEAGTALGGSAIMMALTKSAQRPLQVFDVFGMIPPPSTMDGSDVHQRYEDIVAGKSAGIAGDTYYGYQKDLKEKVTQNFSDLGCPIHSHGVKLIEGLFEDTLPNLAEPVALAHIDGDWYESVRVCLDCIAPRLSRGGRMIFDDYDAWSGCRQAIDEFMEIHGNNFRAERHRRLHLVRIQ